MLISLAILTSINIDSALGGDNPIFTTRLNKTSIKGIFFDHLFRHYLPMGHFCCSFLLYLLCWSLLLVCFALCPTEKSTLDKYQRNWDLEASWWTDDSWEGKRCPLSLHFHFPHQCSSRKIWVITLLALLLFAILKGNWRLAFAPINQQQL